MIMNSILNSENIIVIRGSDVIGILMVCLLIYLCDDVCKNQYTMNFASTESIVIEK